MSKKKRKNNERRYDHLINARNFHYENYNKWMTYFYVAIAAIFIGYYTLLSVEKEIDKPIIIGVTILGFIISLFWYWSSKGYYYWNINFIMLINDHEEKVMKLEPRERVYFVFANKKTQNDYASPVSGANISTSKVAILFAFTISVIWSTMMLHEIFRYYFGHCEAPMIILELLSSIALVIITTTAISRTFLSSEISSIHDLKLEQ